MTKYNITKKDGKYLGYFDTQQEASDHIEDLIRTYRYHPNPRKISVPKMVKEQKEKYGIEINQPSFYRWLEKANIKRRGYRSEEPRVYRTYSLDPVVSRELNSFPNRSQMVELGLKVILGLPCSDVILFLEDGIRVIFTKDRGRIKAITNDKLNERDKKLIRSWVQAANIHGMEHIVNECKRIGFNFYGGDQ